MSGRATTETPHAERAAERLGGGSPLRERFSAKRWRHTLSAAETAYRLARASGWTAVDCDRLVEAALLHDIAKDLPVRELTALAGQARAESLAEAGREPQREEEGAAFAPLLHARAGARLASLEFGIEDDEVLRAIAFHPTASPDASPLAQLLFVADYLEPGRPHLDAEDRALLEQAVTGGADLGELFCHVLRKKLGWVLARGFQVHPRSVAAWNAHCARRD